MKKAEKFQVGHSLQGCRNISERDILKCISSLTVHLLGLWGPLEFPLLKPGAMLKCSHPTLSIINIV